jgi:hypothetical protein
MYRAARRPSKPVAVQDAGALLAPEPVRRAVWRRNGWHESYAQRSVGIGRIDTGGIDGSGTNCFCAVPRRARTRDMDVSGTLTRSRGGTERYCARGVGLSDKTGAGDCDGAAGASGRKTLGNDW